MSEQLLKPERYQTRENTATLQRSSIKDITVCYLVWMDGIPMFVSIDHCQ